MVLRIVEWREPRLTVDGNGHDLGDDDSILALEGGDAPKGVEFEVVGRDSFGARIGVDELDV